MFLFGHVGLTVSAARAVDRRVDLRPAALLSILPDLLDKPAAFLFPVAVSGNTRNFGHSLLACAAVWAGLFLWRRRKGGVFLLWCCYAGHLLLDRIWLNDNPIIALWPFRGPFPPPDPDWYLGSRLLAYNIAGEIVGLALLYNLAARHRATDPRRLLAVIRTGRLPEA